MKKLLLACVVGLVFLTQAFAQVIDWKAVAVANDSDPRMYWAAPVYGESEPEAASRAMTRCEHASARTCERSLATSVPIDWWLVVSWCDGVATTGGSKFDQWAANTRAAMKLGIVMEVAAVSKRCTHLSEYKIPQLRCGIFLSLHLNPFCLQNYTRRAHNDAYVISYNRVPRMCTHVVCIPCI